MCFDIPVNLPVVGSFLLLYSLRTGSITVLIWTVMRSFFSFFFFIMVVLEGLVKRESPFGQIFVHSKEPTTEENVYHLFYCSICLILAEAFLLVYCFHLAHGVLCFKPGPIAQYLTCRFVTWLIEVINLTVLILAHELLIGWYLVICMCVVLEFYGFAVVYSYYMELSENYGSRSCKPCY